MRGTWTPPEALALGSDQHQSQPLNPANLIPEAHQLKLQQPRQTPAAQHTMLNAALEQQYQLQSQFAGRPLQSPTTPAWGTDRIAVKDEPLDDKNNDSGISPGHYTSDSNCNGSLSPSSSIGDLPITQNGFDYSPQRRYHSPDFMNNNYDITKSADIVSSTTNTKSDKKSQLSAEVSPDPLQCPLCKYSTQLRLHFAEHLALHCSAGEKHIDQFRTSVVSQLMNKGQVVKPEEKLKQEQKLPTDEKTEEEEHDPFFDEPGVRVPRVNGQGKVKIFRCKQCPFVAISKLDFWQHCRAHIKPEKLLTCPKCPFVTEYKHHLEYHFRNHFGSKPFQCDQCNYSCVNKSMLNSHLKSHSNVYQFRCSDCAYATKYCHSLKLHLRKYGHHPAMVLNADGTPNPLPIIDVYGTRRGPKAKPKKEKQPHNERPHSPAPTSPNCFAQSPSTPIQGPTSMPNLPQPVVPYQMNPELMAKINFNAFNGVTMPNAMAMSQAMSMQQAMPMPQAMHMQQAMHMPQGMANLMSFPFNPMLAVLVPNPMLFGNAGANPHMNEKQIAAMKAAMMEYASNLAKNMEAKTAEDMSKASFQQPGAGMANMPTPEMESQQYEPDSSDVGALDLSKSEVFVAKDQPMNMTTSSYNYSEIPTVVPTKSIKNRRKGRAIKLDRRVMTNDSDDDMAAED